MTSNPQYYKSLCLKLTEVGKDKSITLPDRIDIQHGQLILKSYTVHFDTTNTKNREININIHGVSQISNVNNSQSFMTLPVSRNSERTTQVFSDIVMYVNGHRLHQSLRYDLLDDGVKADGSEGSPAEYFHDDLPIAVYLNFQYLATGI